jgi:hypothetical protein
LLDYFAIVRGVLLQQFSLPPPSMTRTAPLAVQQYAWSGAARALESFYREILEGSLRELPSEPDWRGSTSVA